MDWPRVARAADTAVVAALAVSGQVVVWTAESGVLAEDRSVHALLLALATVPLFVRRSWPLPVLLLVLGASWVQFELGGQAFQPWFAVTAGKFKVPVGLERLQSANDIRFVERAFPTSLLPNRDLGV